MIAAIGFLVVAALTASTLGRAKGLAWFVFVLIAVGGMYTMGVFS